jgi:hypothetical protein
MNKKDKQTCREICHGLLSDAATISMVTDFLCDIDSPDPRIDAVMHTLRYHEKSVRDNANFIRGLLK